MDTLVLERVPVAGVPEVASVVVGEQRAVVLDDPAECRRLADLLTGLAPLPVGAEIRAGGPIRLVPADGGLLPYLTVQQNLVRANRATRVRVPRDTAIDTCRVSASRCGLDEVLDRYPYEITPGHRRLAGVARALCARATVVVLEDAPGLPTWGMLLDADRNPELLGVALLLITTDPLRAIGFPEFDAADVAAEPAPVESDHA